jgi:hypothetical protein
MVLCERAEVNRRFLGKPDFTGRRVAAADIDVIGVVAAVTRLRGEYSCLWEKLLPRTPPTLKDGKRGPFAAAKIAADRSKPHLRP